MKSWITSLFIILSLNIFSQERYEFDEVLEYEYVDIKNQKKWLWMQLHNRKDNSYQASIHIQDSSEYWFNLTFSKNARHARFKIDNYVLADGYTVLVDKANIHHSNLPKGTRIRSNYTKHNFRLEQIEDKDGFRIRFEVKPKNDRIGRRYKLNSLCYEVDVSKQSHKINFIRDYVTKLFKKETGLTYGIITKRCVKNIDGKIINCIELKKTYDLRSFVTVED